MSEEGTITLKNGISLEIKEWIRRREEAGKITEYRKECKDEILNLKKCIKKRTVKKIISPEYEPKFSEVRYLTDEEIVKEYIMAVSDQENKEKKSKAYRILALMKELGGRAVITNVIASGIKENKRNVSAILSQMRAAGIISSIRSASNKNVFLWKMIQAGQSEDIDVLVDEYNDHIRSVRKRSRKGQIIPPTKDQEQGEEWKKHAGREYYYKEQKEQKPVEGTTTMTKEEIEEMRIKFKTIMEEYQESIKRKEVKELKEKEESKLETRPTSQIVRVIIEGSIKILIGLDK